MKSSYASKLLILFVSLWINCFADCGCPDAELHFISCPKTYVVSDQIDICENGIFVQIDDFIFQTEYLRSDGHGIFFQNIIVSADGCGPAQWRCTKTLRNGMTCETCNWDWNYRCSSCKQEKS
jgi:hypothetical protein